MTVLAAIRSAVLRATGVQLAQVFASTEQIAVEMADLSNDVAADIAESHDWRALTKVATVVNNGGFNFALPSDYNRMTMDASVDDVTAWFWGYAPFQSVSDWLQFQAGAWPILAPGGWIIIGGELQFYPAPISDAQYPYVSNEWAVSSGGTAKAAFTADDDTFILDERLLTLGLIWRWMDQKGLQYSEALASYEMALSQAQARDRGARIIRTQTRRFTGARLAYTGSALG